MHKLQGEEQRRSAARSEAVKIKRERERERIRSVCVCLSCLLGVLSVLLERSSQDTNHTPRLGCLLSTYTQHLSYICFPFTRSVSLRLSLFVSSHPWSVLFHSDVSWPKNGVSLLQDEVMECNVAQPIIWSVACTGFLWDWGWCTVAGLCWGLWFV